MTQLEPTTGVAGSHTGLGSQQRDARYPSSGFARHENDSLSGYRAIKGVCSPLNFSDVYAHPADMLTFTF